MPCVSYVDKHLIKTDQRFHAIISYIGTKAYTVWMGLFKLGEKILKQKSLKGYPRLSGNK